MKEAEARIVHKIAVTWICPDCNTDNWDDPNNIKDGNAQCACNGKYYRLVLNKESKK